jgi:nucleoside-diphosphate-sugar epimerase
MNSRRRLKGLRFYKIMNTTGQKKIVVTPNKVLVTGAGLLGVAAIEKFLSAGWDVVGVSRRKPKLPSGRNIEFLSVDLRDEKAARVAFEPLTDITHIAYTAIHEKSELVAGWSSKEQIETNNAMLRNVVEPIVRTASNFQHISILQGTKIYGVHLHPIPIPARERDARKDHENFFFDHQDDVGEMGARHGFNYTALRPQLVIGPTPGALNVLPAIGAYGAIRREKGEPFSFPGGPSFVWEAADADLVADVMVWAALRSHPRRRTRRSTSLTATYSSGAIYGRPWPKPSVSKPDRTCQRAWRLTSRKTRMSGTRSSRSTIFARGTCGSWLAKGISTRTSRSPTAPRKDLGPS